MKFSSKVRIGIVTVAVLAFVAINYFVMVHLPSDYFFLSTAGTIMVGVITGSAWGALPIAMHRNHKWEKGILFMECFECGAWK